ncbi:MAG: O-antigen ligase family protein [Bdellovibrio sp.]|nr:O-antigen ligase family protein [Bdellovibrio sp.]
MVLKLRNFWAQKIEKKYLRYDDIVLSGLAVIAMVFFISLSLPYSFPLVGVLVFTFSLFYFYSKRKWSDIFSYLKNLRLTVKIILVFYGLTLGSFLFHAKDYYFSDYLVKSAVHRAVFFSLYGLIFFLEIKSSNIDRFIHQFARLTAIAVSIISVFSLLRLFFCYGGICLPTKEITSEWTLFLSALVVDYNFYTLGILSGVFSILFLWKRNQAFPKIFLYLMLVDIYFSTSRRAAILVLALCGYFLIHSFVVSRKEGSVLPFFKTLGLFVFILSFWMYVPSFVQKNFSPESKRSIFKLLGWNYNYVSEYLPMARHRYYTMIDQNTSLDHMRGEFYKGKDSFFLISSDPFSISSLSSGRRGGGGLSTGFKLEDLEIDGFSDLNPSDGGRKERWLYAIEEFKSYSWTRKLLGAGGSYHFSFGKKFDVGQEKIPLDYPHNFLLSLLLYSGVLSTLIFIVAFASGAYFLRYANFLTIGLFGAVYFYNFFSLDLLWGSYHFPFVVVFGFKAFEIFGVNRHCELDGTYKRVRSS